MRSRAAEPRRAAAPEPSGPRRALGRASGRGRVRVVGLLAVAVLVVGAGVVAGPALSAAITPVGTTTAALPAAPIAPAAVSTSAVPSGSASATPDCRAVQDTRRTAAARKVPFSVCGVELISKDHRVTAAYKPDLVTVNVRRYNAPTVQLQPAAAKALIALFAAGRKAGYTLVVRSSYRSYATQKQWYATMSHALTAPPGGSEHQSGLAVDLAGIERRRLIHGTLLATSATGKWLVSHAAGYGFILRYPTSQAKITGIAYEPWHFRYVGVAVARGVNATRTKTLERYLGEG